jgi:hypothetical protein
MNDKNRKAVELILKLHKMIDVGRGRDDQTDQIREELDSYCEAGDQQLTTVLNSLSGLLNDDRDARKSLGLDAEIVSGTVRVPVEFTVKQYMYLQDLAEDLRGSFDDAVQVYVNKGMEASANGGARYEAAKAFEHILMCCDWQTTAPALLERFRLLLKKAEVDHELREKKG